LFINKKNNPYIRKNVTPSIKKGWTGKRFRDTKPVTNSICPQTKRSWSSVFVKLNFKKSQSMWTNSEMTFQRPQSERLFTVLFHLLPIPSEELLYILLCLRFPFFQQHWKNCSVWTFCAVWFWLCRKKDPWTDTEKQSEAARLIFYIIFSMVQIVGNCVSLLLCMLH